MTQTRFEDFFKAIKRLEESIKEFGKNTNNDFVRDSVIQRFEFTFELGWKCLADFLIEKSGSIPAKAPRPVFMFAWQAGYLKEETPWNIMLEDRNMMSHTYKEDVATVIAQRVCKDHIKALKNLSDLFQQ